MTAILTATAATQIRCSPSVSSGIWILLNIENKKTEVLEVLEVHEVHERKREN